MNKAVILFSGGLDSTTCLAIAKDLGFSCHTLSFDYGQRHRAELEAARRIAQNEAQSHLEFKLDIGQFGGSALTDEAIEVPLGEDSHQIPNTYVPARNITLLAIALGYAETLKAHDIFIGVSAIDYSNYPDCRPEFIQAFEAMASLGTKSGVQGQAIKIHTPLIQLSKAQTIQEGLRLGVDYSLTRSCYQLNAVGEACGNCDSCRLRKKGFEEAGIKDPTLYLRDG